MGHIEQFLAARRVSTPLLMIQTADPYITYTSIWSALAEQQKKSSRSEPPLLVWDCVRGLRWLNDEGKKAAFAAAGVNTDDELKSATVNPTECLELAAKLPAPKSGEFKNGSILFFLNAHAGFDPPNPNYIQAIWNLRDQFKTNRRQLVLLTPGCTLPPELTQDVYVINEPLPTGEELEGIITRLFKNIKQPVPEGLLARAKDALSGLGAFPAEQVSAMSIERSERANPDGEMIASATINLDGMWDRKRQLVEGTPGLTVYRGSEKFDDIGGLTSIKTFLRRFIAGKRPPRLVLFLDELEKMLGGSDTDTSGSSQMVLGKLLTWMQDKNKRGMVKTNGLLAVGHAGTGKSLIAKACGNEAGVPTVLFDLGSVKSSLVGSSEARMDAALKIIDAIGQGEILVIATSNRIESLKPELRSRFQLGTWFFDLPTDEEKSTIWPIHRAKFEIESNDVAPLDEGWVGREIEACCNLASLFNSSLKTAAEYITPSKETNEEAITSLRRKAHGRYLSASTPGVYKFEMAAAASGASRAIDMDD